MRPTFNDGDWLLFRAVPPPIARKLQRLVGKVVIVERESYPGVHFIKRIVSADHLGIWVEGDNKEVSTDSRSWGAITPDEVVGVVLLRYKRARINE